MEKQQQKKKAEEKGKNYFRRNSSRWDLVQNIQKFTILKEIVVTI